MSRKYVVPPKNRKSINLQENSKKGYFICTKCNEEKPESEFYRSMSRKSYCCKICWKQYYKKRPKKVSYNSLW
ncbi:MAG: hypothetical protein Tp152DCM223801_20 [Prokaryotic dsDNA virus sp.]|mgnify:CR=1 FL=1|nr:MAG: hypothetical protein Tp152DCM223801_20 [Prokaryotic dsDNA virus sp.]